jgi:23S rRNA (guanosine2251-2'-O)-methyltransferase
MNRKLKLWELNRLTTAEFKQQQKFPIVLVLDNIRSLNNIGSFFRTADAFNIEKIYLCGISAKPPHREIQKTALGATDAVSWEYFEDVQTVIDSLKQQNFQLLAIEQAEKTVLLQNINPAKNQKYALIFGNEVNGVNQEIMDQCHTIVEVPQYGTKHSINVAVCAGIVLWEFVRMLNVKK